MIWPPSPFVSTLPLFLCLFSFLSAQNPFGGNGGFYPQCPMGQKADGTCNGSFKWFCADPKERCFFGLCCQPSQSQSSGLFGCPAGTFADGTCSGLKFWCADLREKCIYGLCCQQGDPPYGNYGNALAGGMAPFGNTAMTPYGNTAIMPYGNTAMMPYGNTAMMPYGNTAMMPNGYGGAGTMPFGYDSGTIPTAYGGLGVSSPYSAASVLPYGNEPNFLGDPSYSAMLVQYYGSLMAGMGRKRKK